MFAMSTYIKRICYVMLRGRYHLLPNIQDGGQ